MRDNTGICMYVSTTKHVRVDSEILVMFRPDGEFCRPDRGLQPGACVRPRRAHETRLSRVCEAAQGIHASLQYYLLPSS